MKSNELINNNKFAKTILNNIFVFILLYNELILYRN